MHYLMRFKSFLAIFFCIFSFLSSASHYGIEKITDVASSLNYASSITWVDINNDLTKFLVVTHETETESSHAVASFIKIFEINSGTIQHEFNIKKGIEIKRAIFNKDDKYVHAIADNNYNNGRITTLNASRPFTEHEIKFIERTEKLNCLTISPNGELLVVGGDHGYLSFLNPFTLEPEKDMPLSAEEKDIHERTTALNFNQNGEKIISAHQANHSSLIKIFNSKTGDCEFTLKNNNYWNCNNIRSINFNPLDENLVNFTTANKFYTVDKNDLSQSFFHKTHSDYVAINQDGMMAIVNKRGQLRELITNNTYKPKLSEDVIEINKRVPLISFKDHNGLRVIVGTSDYSKHSKSPVVFFYKQIPSFSQIQQRQITGGLSILRKKKTTSQEGHSEDL